jgi:hypothetical protein
MNSSHSIFTVKYKKILTIAQISVFLVRMSFYFRTYLIKSIPRTLL